MIHQQIYEFFDTIKDQYDPSYYATSHRPALPVPYTIIDNFLPDYLYKQAVNEIELLSEWTVFSNDKSYRQECKNLTPAPIIQSITHSFQSSKFLKWLTEVTGIEKLIGDPHYRGGGVCRVPSGSSLGLHTDFNWNDQIKLTRRVNLILYMNPHWESSWGGDLEFWNIEKTKCEVKIQPMPNRLAIWDYNENHVHGHPNPLNTPKGIYRQNLILFYYSSNSTHETPPHKSQFV